nr:prostatic acid phosphatase [Helicoverpa armigera]
MLVNSAFLFLLGFSVPIAGKCCRTVAETDLVMVFLVHRHGDRSSEKVQMFLSDNPEELARMSEPYGFGQLTDSGKARSYALGQYLRHRYNALLSPSYDASEIFVRSTESDRTQMTARIALTGVYSSEVLWSEDMEIVPVEIDVVPAKVDPNLSFMNCPKLTSYFLGFQAENKNEDMKNYEEVLDVLFEEMGLNLPKCPLLMYAMADCFASQESVGMPFTALQQKLGPAVRQGARQAINYMFGNPEYIPLQSG